MWKPIVGATSRTSLPMIWLMIVVLPALSSPSTRTRISSSLAFCFRIIVNKPMQFLCVCFRMDQPQIRHPRSSLVEYSRNYSTTTSALSKSGPTTAMSKKGKRQSTIFDLTERRAKCLDMKTRHAEISAQIGCPVCDSALDMLAMEERIRHVEECLSLSSISNNRVSWSSDSALGTKEPFKMAESGLVAEQNVTRIIRESNSSGERAASEISGPKQEATPQIHRNNNSEVLDSNRKRKLGLGPRQKDMLRYVNSEPNIKKKRAKPSQVDTAISVEAVELLPSSRKSNIPKLKILQFPVTHEENYCIAVDAFSYKPDELIDQYFLSHFHSDHYGGMSKRWCRERSIDRKIIYCSLITGRLLKLRYDVEECFLFSMENNIRYKVRSFEHELVGGGMASCDQQPGLYVTLIDANHCPGAVIFLFEGIAVDGKSSFTLHCGDFRVSSEMMNHPALQRFRLGGPKQFSKVYLDTTYMSPKYNFPKQEQVCDSVAHMIKEFLHNDDLVKSCFGNSLQSRITDFLSLGHKSTAKKYLVLVGTYLIGKEKLAVAISKRLGGSPIYISNVHSRGDKEEIIRSYKDPYLDSVLSADPVGAPNHEVMIHLVPMKIAGNIQEIQKYFTHNQYHKQFGRCIGLRPTGWSFEGNSSEEDIEWSEETIDPSIEEVDLDTTISLLKNKPSYDSHDIVRQNQSKKTHKVDRSIYKIYSVPYSEHSSFRELSYFVVFLNIKTVIPTVNTGRHESERAMADIISRWEALRELVARAALYGSEIAPKVRGLSLDDF